MKPSVRVMLLGIVIEAALAGTWAYLLSQITSQTMKTTVPPAEAAETISSVMGPAMGGLAGLLIVVILVLRRGGR